MNYYALASRLKTFEPQEARRLADVLEAYLAALRTEGLIDEAESLWRAADVVTEQRSVLVVGYPRVGPADLAFLDRIAGEGSVLFLPYTSQPLFEDNRRAATILEERGWVVQEGYDEPVALGERVAQRYIDSTAPCPRLAAHVFPDLEAEVRGALARVKGFLHDGVPVADIVLVARDERSYGPLLKAVAWEYGVPIRLMYRIPLAETRIGAWLLLLAEVLSDPFSFETTARFLAHPFANGLNGDAWRAARKLHPQDASDWMNCGADVSPLIWPESGT